MTHYPITYSKKSRIVPVILCILSVILMIGNYGAYKDRSLVYYGISALLWAIGSIAWLVVSIRRLAARDSIVKDGESFWFCRSVGGNEVAKEPISAVTEDQIEFHLLMKRKDLNLSKKLMSEDLRDVLEAKAAED